MPKRILTYRWFAKSYGWTPREVDALPAGSIGWFYHIEAAQARADDLRRPKGRHSR